MDFKNNTCVVILFFATCTGLMNMAKTHAQQADELYKPLIDRGYKVTEFDVQVGERQFPAVIASPHENQLAEDPVLLLTIGGASTHLLPPNDQPTRYFLERGHRVVSLSVYTMPSLEHYRDLILEGPDPAEAFIADAQAVIQHCIDQGWAKRGRVVVSGISRFAYLALRLMAADDTINIGGGFAPVTDWQYLYEFAGHENAPAVTATRLSNFADDLAGKKIYLAIGNHDQRVSTQSCCQLYIDLNEANVRAGYSRERVDFFVTPSPGHTMGDEWFERGMAILLEAATSKQTEPSQ